LAEPSSFLHFMSQSAKLLPRWKLQIPRMAIKRPCLVEPVFKLLLVDFF
jgi:hypothetical protein